MECQPSDSKKLFKVFDASKRKRTRKKQEGLDDTNSAATDDSNSGYQATVCRVMSAKASLQDVLIAQTADTSDANQMKRDRDSSPSVTRSPVDDRRNTRSPRRHRRPQREGISLALKAGLVSTPRSISPPQEGDGALNSIPRDQDSFIYAFLEEAIKRDKKKHRHSRRHEDRRASRDRDVSDSREHRHRHRRRHDDVPPREHDQPRNEGSPAIDQTVFLETLAKFCAHLNEKTVTRTQSHKSLQCEVVSRRDSYDVDQHPVRLHNYEHSREHVPPRIRSQENFRGRDNETQNHPDERGKDKCGYCSPYDKDSPKYSSKMNVTRSRRNVEDDRYRDYPDTNQTRSVMEHGYRPRAPPDHYYDERRRYDDDKRRYFEQKTSRSFDVHRESYPDEDRHCRRTARSDSHKDKRYEDERDKRYDDRDHRDKFYESKPLDVRDRHFADIPSKDRRSKRNVERFERNSVASKEDDFRERCSERERDSGLSVADGETSTVSGRSNYLRVVKQEITEQREAMDKMMKLWKELMRCFKGMSQTQGQEKAIHDSAANVRESAAAQLRLWRECMRRYETVARDVGDTDARLMEEINKQRSEMAEMANMWQECLQRYREMSTDFNSLKQQLARTESPTRIPAPPLVCAEGEGTVPPAPYRLPPHYPQLPTMPGGYPNGGSPLRPRASAPPAWWWCGEGVRESPRRRSSPDSRGSRERRHRHKDRDESRYKEKSSKPSAARSEHRHRKR